MFVFQPLDTGGSSIKIKIESGEFEGKTIESYEVRRCLDVTCACGNIYFSVDSSEDYSLDTETHSLIKYTEYDSIDSSEDPFLLALENEITPDQWDELEESMINLKGMASEIVDVDRIEPDFEDYEEILSESRLVGYFEILPWSFDLSIEVDGIKYVFIDFYCVQPGCDCSSVMLFIAKDIEQEPDLEIWFDYKTREVEIGELNNRTLPVARILREFSVSQFDDFKDILGNRHERMMTFFANFLIRNDISPLPDIQLPLSKLLTIGRNDPCPCGSGKKYKKCCGA